MKTLAQMVRRNLLISLGLLAGFGATYAVVASALVVEEPPNLPAVEASVPAVEASVPTAEGLVTRHGCWTGEPPAEMVGVIPGHVVVRVGDGAPFYAGERMTGLALDQLFGGATHNLTVYGFCR